MRRSWLLLGLAIFLEIFGFYALEMSDGLSRAAPTVVVFAAFSLTFWLLARVMRRLPLGLVYALWSGCTTVLASLMDLVVFDQQLAFGQALGICLIIAGTVWLHLSLSGNGEEIPPGSALENPEHPQGESTHHPHAPAILQSLKEVAR